MANNGTQYSANRLRNCHWVWQQDKSYAQHKKLKDNVAQLEPQRVISLTISQRKKQCQQMCPSHLSVNGR